MKPHNPFLSECDIINMAHWLSTETEYSFSGLTDTADKYGFTVKSPANETGPVTLTHTDGSEITIVRATHTQTFAVEYEPDDSAKAGVNLNKRTHHHQSFGMQEPNNALEWAVNIMKQHDKKN
jgi:hypothetical protein